MEFIVYIHGTSRVAVSELLALGLREPGIRLH